MEKFHKMVSEMFHFQAYLVPELVLPVFVFRRIWPSPIILVRELPSLGLSSEEYEPVPQYLLGSSQAFFAGFFFFPPFFMTSFSAYSFMFWLSIYCTSLTRVRLNSCMSECHLVHVHRNTCMYFYVKNFSLFINSSTTALKIFYIFCFKVKAAFDKLRETK